MKPWQCGEIKTNSLQETYARALVTPYGEATSWSSLSCLLWLRIISHHDSYLFVTSCAWSENDWWVRYGGEAWGNLQGTRCRTGGVRWSWLLDPARLREFKLGFSFVLIAAASLSSLLKSWELGRCMDSVQMLANTCFSQRVVVWFNLCVHHIQISEDLSLHLRDCSPKDGNSVIIYSASRHFEPIWLSSFAKHNRRYSEECW